MTGAEQANLQNDVRTAEQQRRKMIDVLIEIRELLQELLAEVKK